jgi:ABC-2 type transport system permease protein
MRTLPVFVQDLREGGRALLGWSIGLVVVMLVYLPFYGMMGGNREMQDLIETLPPAFVETLGYEDMFSGPGYVQATIFGLLGFVLTTIAAVSWGARAIAGDEETGTLELTLAHRVSRERVVLERSLSILVRLLALGLVVGVMLLLVGGPFDLDLDGGNIAAAVAALVALVLTTAMAAVAAGAVIGRRTVALASGAGLAVAGYVANAVGGQSERFAWLVDISPYAWAYGNDPLKDGWDLGGLGLLLALSAVLLGVAVLAFRRRDVGT